MRIRTLVKAAEYFKAQDPDTSLTYWALRRAVKDGTIPHQMNGRNVLVDIDVIERQFSGKKEEEATA